MEIPPTHPTHLGLLFFSLAFSSLLACPCFTLPCMCTRAPACARPSVRPLHHQNAMPWRLPGELDSSDLAEAAPLDDGAEPLSPGGGLHGMSDAGDPATTDSGDAGCGEAVVADWCSEGVPLLFAPAFPNALPSAGPVQRLKAGSRFKVHLLCGGACGACGGAVLAVLAGVQQCCGRSVARGMGGP